MTKFKVGDKVRVTKCLHGHGFDIDEVVEIIHHNISHNDYECENNTDSWFLRDTEFELYEEKETEMALTNEMTAEQIRNEIIRINSRIEEANKDIEKAQEERNSLVEKLREKGFTLAECHVEDKPSTKDIQTLDEVVVGESYIVTNNFGAAYSSMTGRTVIVEEIDFDACDLFIYATTEDGRSDWMHYQDLAKI